MGNAFKLRRKGMSVTRFDGGGATNYTRVDNLGNISQAGAASAALGDLTTASLNVGTGTDIAQILFGTFSPCFNTINAGQSDTGSGTITGMSVDHKIFLSPCTMPGGTCLLFAAACAKANSVQINIVNAGTDNSTSSTCPWAYLAIK